MQPEQALDFKDSELWRQWLQENHCKENEVWLVIRKKGSEGSGITYAQALEEAICFGWIDGKMKSIDAEKFILRYTPRKKKSPWSKINKEKAEELIESGRMTPAGLEKIEEAKKNGLWHSAYTSLKGEVIPQDLQQALSGNSEAEANFLAFANSYRNSYIGWVNSAKTQHTREKRIAEVVKRAFANRKPG